MSQIIRPEQVGILSKYSTSQAALAASVVYIGRQSYSNSSPIYCSISTSGFGGLDIGLIAANSTYYIYAVVNNGVIGLVASLSSVSPTGFLGYRQVGAFTTTSGSAIDSVTNSGASQLIGLESSLVEQENTLTNHEGRIVTLESGIVVDAPTPFYGDFGSCIPSATIGVKAYYSSWTTDLANAAYFTPSFLTDTLTVTFNKVGWYKVTILAIQILYLTSSLGLSVGAVLTGTSTIIGGSIYENWFSKGSSVGGVVNDICQYSYLVNVTSIGKTIIVKPYNIANNSLEQVADSTRAGLSIIKV
jgi:hypothetical protein